MDRAPVVDLGRAGRVDCRTEEVVCPTLPSTRSPGSDSPRYRTAPVEPASSAQPTWRRSCATCPALPIHES
jgi:hypothetical protein